MSDLGSLLEQFPPDEERAAGAVAANLDADPATAAQAYRISAETGASPELIYQDVKGFQSQIDAQKAQAAIQSSPPLATWLAKNPFAAKVAADELPALADYAGEVGGYSTIQGLDLTSGFESIAQGWKHHEYGEQAGAYQFGFGGDADLKAYEEAQAKRAPSGFMGRLGEFLGQMAGNVAAAVPVAAAGAAAGAAVGATAGGVGAIPGAVTGAIAGFGYGFFADLVYTGTGEVYRSLDLARDKFGQPLPEATKQTAALTGGLAMGLLAQITPAALFAPLKNAWTSLIGEVVTRAAAEPAVSSFLAKAGTEIAKAGLSGGVINTLFSLASTIPPEIAKTLSGQPFETILNDPTKREELVQNLVQSAVDGASLFAVMAIPGVGAHAVIDQVRIAQTRTAAAQLDKIMQATAQLKLRQRSPEMLAELIREQNKGDVGIPVEAIDRVRAEHPDAFNYVKDLEEQIAQVRETGGDVVIPAADYFAKTDPAVHGLVKDDIRAHGEAMTPNEANELEKNPISYEAAVPEAPVYRDALRGSDGTIHVAEPGESYGDLSARVLGSYAIGPNGELISGSGARVGPPEKGYVTADGRFLSRGEMEAEQAAATQAQAAGGPPPLRGGSIASDYAWQLRDAGRSAEEAAYQGALVQAWYEARAATAQGRRGTAEELYRAEPPPAVVAGVAGELAPGELAQRGVTATVKSDNAQEAARTDQGQALPARVPTGVGAPANRWVDDNAIPDLATLQSNERLFTNTVNAVGDEPGMGHNGGPPLDAPGAEPRQFASIQEKADYLIGRLKDNLLWLWDQVPAEIRDRSRLWYDGAQAIATEWGDRWGKTRTQVAGMLAVLSPQKDWFMNTTMGERIGDIMHQAMGHRWDERMDSQAFKFLLGETATSAENRAAYAAIKGKTLREVVEAGGPIEHVGMWLRAYDEAHHSAAHAIITPEGAYAGNMLTQAGEEARRAWGDYTAIGKAASIFMDGSPENISLQIGMEHKVRNFYNNIFHAMDPRYVTIDTHAVAADLVRTLAGNDKAVGDNFGNTGSDRATGLKGSYALHAEAYRQAAEARGVLPREMQSVTWEAIRGLFPDSWKTAANKAAVTAIWDRVGAGELSIADARAQILELAGGINPPAWHEEGGGSPSLDRTSTYAPEREPPRGPRVTFEVAPDPRNPALVARWLAAPQHLRDWISHQVAWQIGKDILEGAGEALWGRRGSKQLPHVIKGELHRNDGGWLDDPNPSLSLHLDASTPSGTVGIIARLAGYALRQQETLRVQPKQFPGGLPTDAILVRLPEGATTAEVDAVYQQIRELKNEKGEPYVIGHTTGRADRGMEILNNNTDAPIATAELARLIDQKLGGRYDVDSGSLHAQRVQAGSDEYGLSGAQVSGRAGEEVPGEQLRRAADNLRQSAEQQIDEHLTAHESRAAAGEPRAAEPVAAAGEPGAGPSPRGPPEELEQAGRGKIRLGTDQLRALITLFRDADASTFLHEFSHYAVTVFFADAEHPLAPPELREDAAILRRWLGMEEDATTLTREQQEQLASGMEQFFREGKAPTRQLDSVFAKIGEWMQQIYRTADQLGVPINDEVRGVFGRMFGAEAGPAPADLQAQRQTAVRDSLFLNPLFKNGQAAGMSEADFRRYSKLVQNVQDALNERTFQTARREEARRQTAEWKERTASLRPQVSESFDQRRDVQADKSLREGTARTRITMDRQVVGELMNDPNYADSLDPRMFGTERTEHPDAVAELYGYPSGIAMLHDLRALQEDRAQHGETPAQQRTRMIESETQRRMEEQYGKLEVNIQKAALDAVLQSAQMDLMHEEVKALAGQAGMASQFPLTREEAELANRERFTEVAAKRGMNVRAWERLVGQKGLAAERALLAGDPAKAFLAKQEQYNATLMLKEARDFRDQAEQTEKLVRTYQKQSVRVSRDPEYVAQIHRLLREYQFKLSRNPQELDNALVGKGSLKEFYQEKTNDGRILVDPELLPAKPVDDWTVADLRAFGDVVKSLDTVGREEKSMLVEGRRVELAQVRKEVGDNLATHGERFDPADKSYLSLTKRAGRGFDAMVIRMERLFDWIDRRDPAGPLNRYVLRGLFDARNWKADELNKVGERLAELGKNLSMTKMREVVDNQVLKDIGIGSKDGRLRVLTNENKIVIALNMGNRSNFDKLLRGMDWDRQTVMSWIDRNMTKPEWDYVQGIWDLFHDYFPMRDAIVRRVSGVGMDPIEAVPIPTRHGQIDGGYYPIIYDFDRSPTTLGAKRMTAEALFPNNAFFSPLPAKGSTITRKEEVAYPISLDLKAGLTNRINEMLHDIAFREPLIRASRVLLQGNFGDQVRLHYGPEYEAQIRPWLRNIAQGTAIDDTGLQWLNRFSQAARMNAQVLGIGFSPLTALVHGGSAMFNSASELMRVAGISATPQLLASVFTQWGKYRQFVMDNSPEVRNRMHNLDRDLNRVIEQHVGDWSLSDKFQYASHWHISFLDQMSAVPTWMISYQHYLEQGMPEADAAYAADKIVRNAHGSSDVISQPAILRGGQNELLKWFTMFMGYFNHNYNQLRDIGRVPLDDIGTGTAKFVTVATGSMMYLLAPALWHAFLRPAPTDKDESWGKWTATALLDQVAGSIPFVRDIAYAIKSGRQVDPSPMGQLLNSFVETMKDVGIIKTAGSSPRNWVQHTVDTFGLTTGLATHQLGRDLQFLWDLHTGRQSAHTAAEWYHGLVQGQSHPKQR